MDKREAATLSVNKRENYKQRLEFLVKREIIAEHYLKQIKVKQFFPKQQMIWDAWINGAQYLLVRGGRRSAKTVTCSLMVPAEMSFGPEGMMPQRLVVHTGPKFEVTNRVGSYLYKWMVQDELYGFKARSTESENESWIRLPWNAKIKGKTTKEPDNLLGDGLAGVISDEDARIAADILPNYFIPTLADTGGWLACISTPRGKLNHFYDTELEWKRKMESGDPRYFVQHMTSYDNPYVSHQEFDDLKEYCERTGQIELWWQECMAEYTSLAGAIYKRFTETKSGTDWHVSSVDYIPGIPISLGLDWGTDHPFVCIFGQVVDSDRMNVFDVISETGLDPEQQIERVLKILDSRRVDLAYCDPSGLGNKMLFQNNGVHVFKPSIRHKSALNDVKGGITEVNKLLARVHTPGLQIDKSCDKLIKGLQNYQWGANEKPEKINDDECDALRYLVMGAIGLYTPLPPM